MSVIVGQELDGISMVFSVPEGLPVEVPEGVERWKLKDRPNDWPMIYLKFTDRFEKWYVGVKHGKAVVPTHKIGSNTTGVFK